MQEITLYKLFQLGGWAMYPLLVFSVAAVALILERTIALLYFNLKVRDIHQTVIENIETNNINKAIDYLTNCKKRKLGADIILAGLKLSDLGEHRMEKGIEQEALEKINKLERGFDFLVAIGSLAPITGFLGTVSGMIGAFQSIAKAADVNAQLVAGGIFEALITTAFGLCISIIAIAGYNIFTHFVDSFVADIEQVGGDTVTAVLIQKNEGNPLQKEESEEAPTEQIGE